MAVSSSVQAPFARITVDVPSQQFNRDFNSWEDVRKWLDEEATFWEGVVGKANSYLATFNRSIEPSLLFPATLRGFINKIDSQQRQSALNQDKQLIKDIENAIVEGLILVQRSTLGQRFLDMFERRPDVAALALTLHPKFGQPSTIRLESGGVISLEGMMAAYRLRFPPALDEMDVRTGGLNDRHETVSDLIRKLEQDIANVDRLRDALDKELRLAKPAKYWSDVAHSQRAAMWGASIAMFVLIVVGGYIYFAHFLSGWLPEVAAMMLSGSESATIKDLIEDAPLFTFLSASAPLLILLWMLRYPSKIFMQALAMKADADHRVAMTKAYLALTKEPNLLKTERETELILQALYRPGPGDSPDVSPHESYMSALGQILRK